MELFMNEPEETLISDQDIFNEYEKTKDKRAIARRYCIKVADVTAIVKRKSLTEQQGGRIE